MSNSLSTPETPPQLVDAVARIGQAGADYVSLTHELNEFLYEFVKGMVKPPGPDNENFALQLRHPDEGIVSGRPGVLNQSQGGMCICRGLALGLGFPQKSFGP